jgi:hypothetical protein
MLVPINTKAVTFSPIHLYILKSCGPYTVCAYFGMWKLLSGLRNCLFLYINMFTEHFTGPRWIQFKPPHLISLFSYVKIYQFYQQQDGRSKKTYNSFTVCEVRQNCKHTVKSREDEAGVLWGTTSNWSNSTSNDKYLWDDECIASVSPHGNHSTNNSEIHHQKIKSKIFKIV